MPVQRERIKNIFLTIKKQIKLKELNSKQTKSTNKPKQKTNQRKKNIKQKNQNK